MQFETDKQLANHVKKVNFTQILPGIRGTFVEISEWEDGEGIDFEYFCLVLF